MKNFLQTLITFLVDLFTRKPQVLETSDAVELAPILEDPNSVPQEEIEAILTEVDVDNEATPDAPEVIPDTPEVEEVYEDLNDDAETALEDLIEIGGGVEINE